ncbi:hypothetical protein D8674_034391 [Pyrus ussuriensis x Pyrus communis]|uniref:Uncharacterized protein n=1 Tax=Pyrus ussuriensis x Pyrus communis TaxID=2448454 RepID=A0A5N5HNU1_9ROSA|nr:hypothetical protein D8674_034391 [Pyrus ussuriensis x Pyrus communis]
MVISIPGSKLQTNKERRERGGDYPPRGGFLLTKAGSKSTRTLNVNTKLGGVGAVRYGTGGVFFGDRGVAISKRHFYAAPGVVCCETRTAIGPAAGVASGRGVE